jgi:hypothetical protein
MSSGAEGAVEVDTEAKWKPGYKYPQHNSYAITILTIKRDK